MILCFLAEDTRKAPPRRLWGTTGKAMYLIIWLLLKKTGVAPQNGSERYRRGHVPDIFKKDTSQAQSGRLWAATRSQCM